MKKEFRELDEKREVLNELAEKIDILDMKEKSILQQVSEEMDILILEYIKNAVSILKGDNNE